jgi:UDP-GlcNAc:undecaprenyl-phosphate GlcNAc-1-phosphate transferase
MGIVTVPRLWRHEPRPTPLLGSLALVAGIAAGVLVAAPGALASRKLAAAAVGVLAMAAVGLLDDIKGLTPRTRLLSAAIVAEIGWVLGLRAEVFPPGPAGEIANALLTMLWFVGVTHAFNMFDNMDGTSAGVAMASSLSVAALATVSDQGVLVIWALAVAGACFGYLLHNVFPARLYMGDSGALALGFAVAALGLMLQPSTVRPLGFALPVLAVGVPIFDTVMVTISRIRRRKRVAIGGTDHMTHRLHRAGLGVRAVAALFFLAQLILGCIAGIVALIPRGAGYATVALTVAAGVLTLVLFLGLPEWQPSGEEAAPAP